jgi:energy-coupling factor transporter ATP-binding protein EcfA2
MFTMLQAKLSLAVERLVTPTSLLILDEPGWCLSKQIARAYLAAITEIAHSMGTALLIISHQDHWWQGILRSRLQMRSGDEGVQIKVT